MDVSNLLDQLNKPQRDAVCSDADNLLVLAGAGSGKTRVLVHRIAWLIQVKHVPAHSILAVTFTNKAAKEMKQRIDTLLNMPTRGMWVGTFHGLAHRLLRTHWHDLGLNENFQVLDSDDQKRLLKRIMKEMSIDDKELSLRDILSFINNSKDNGQRSSDLEHVYDYRQKQLQAIYKNYEILCNRSSLVDFAELLLKAHELWLNHPHILEHYQNRFRYLMIDEFQDTNTIQYAWIKVLSGANKEIKNSSIMVVGDDDQSIYGWRGAKIEHIQQFEHDFSPAEVIKLEQNYRSTSNILNAANAVIENNTQRLGKKLWTDDKEGDPIFIYQAYNEYDEAEYIVDQILQYQEKDLKRSEMAVLYRSNAQSRVIEEYLLRQGVAYRVYGGLRFFDRAEIRDALAYLRLINSRHDDAALERIINLPTRGIGSRTIDKIRQYAREAELPLWHAANLMIEQKQLTGKAANSISNFMAMIDGFQLSIKQEKLLSLAELLEDVYHISGLKEFHSKENNERARSRVENLDELINALEKFEELHDPLDNMDDLAEIIGLTESPLATSAATSAETTTLTDTSTKASANKLNINNLLGEFLSHAVLESSENQGEEWDDCVQLMTLHSAKGLEFKSVFLAGLEQGLFPHKMASEDQNKLEEERRLCYVGITRAMKNLHISFADYRSKYGKSEFCRPSQFLDEIPNNLLFQVKATNSAQAFISESPQQDAITFNNTFDPDDLYTGKAVVHKKFGQGIVLALEGSGAKKRVQVNFSSAGTKWLLAAIAKLG